MGFLIKQYESIGYQDIYSCCFNLVHKILGKSESSMLFHGSFEVFICIELTLCATCLISHLVCFDLSDNKHM